MKRLEYCQRNNQLHFVYREICQCASVRGLAPHGSDYESPWPGPRFSDDIAGTEHRRVAFSARPAGRIAGVAQLNDDRLKRTFTQERI
jgi:hypothetical protein